MVEIQSKEVIDKMSDELKIQPALLLPRELGKMIVPVYNVNAIPKVQIKNENALNVTAATIHTCHATKQTYLIGLTLTGDRAATNGGDQSNISVTTEEGNTTQNPMMIRYPVSTAGSFHDHVAFGFPIKLKKGSIIAVNNASSTDIDTTGIIYFYETDPQ